MGVSTQPQGINSAAHREDKVCLEAVCVSVPHCLELRTLWEDAPLQKERTQGEVLVEGVHQQELSVCLLGGTSFSGLTDLLPLKGDLPTSLFK